MQQHASSDNAPPNTLITYALLAFVAMAGLSYLNFMPGVVNALAGGIGLNDAQAGQVIAMNGYGGILGSTLAIFLVRHLPWQRAMLISMGLLAILDFSTAWLSDYTSLMIWRFIAGILGGLCVGFGFSALARLDNPDRAFGLMLFIQFSLGSLVISVLPVLEKQFDAYAVFYLMAGFALLSLPVLAILPPLKHKPATRPASRTVTSLSAESNSGLLSHTLLLLLAILVYQIAASAIWAYASLIGLSTSLSHEAVSLYIAGTGLLGLAGALLPVIQSNNRNRLALTLAGVLLSTIAAVLLNFSQDVVLFITALSLLFFAWPAVLSWLLAVTAEQDSSGRLSTIASVVSSLGMASGPLLASMLLGQDDFSTMLYTCSALFVLSALFLIKPLKARRMLTAPVLQTQ